MMDTDTQNRTEQAILGAVINKPKYLHELGITADYFLIGMNQVIYKSLLSSYDEDTKEINMARLGTILNNNELDYYIRLQESYVSDVQLENYVNDLSDRYITHQFEQITEELKDGTITIEGAKNKTKELYERNLFAVSQELPTPPELFEMISQKDSTINFRIYKNLGTKIGFKENSLHVISARTSIGKSALSLNLFNDLSQNPKYKCMYFNLEMEPQEIYERLIAMNTRIKTNELPNHKNEIENAWSDIRNRIYIKSDGLYIEDLNRKILKEQKKAENHNKHFIVFIDYLGLIRTRSKYNSDREKIGQMVRDIHAIMKDRQCTIFLLVQLNRGADDTPPSITNLKDSGEIEQTAHSVLLLRDLSHEQKKGEGDETHIMLLDVVKNRSGRKGQISMKYHHTTQLFSEMTEQEFYKWQNEG